jgi:hypothetical protein
MIKRKRRVKLREERANYLQKLNNRFEDTLDLIKKSSDYFWDMDIKLKRK